MVNITFKYVGAGDCIFIEWDNDEGDECIGIIDCNLNGNLNSGVEYLRDKEVNHVRFVVLSHPHHDHYSGLYDVINYCYRHDIKIDFFGHTVRAGKQYIKSVIGADGKKSQLRKLFGMVTSMRNEGMIRSAGYLDDDRSTLSLGDGVKLKFLAPNIDDIERFLKLLFDANLEMGLENDYANYLCTIIMIYGEGWYALLTSDAKERVMDRVGIQKLRKENRNLTLGQVPHHGSEENHSK